MKSIALALALTAGFVGTAQAFVPVTLPSWTLQFPIEGTFPTPEQPLIIEDQEG